MAASTKLSPAATAQLALTSYLGALERRPVATKSATSGLLYLVSEIVSTQLAKPTAGRQYAAAAGGKEAKERLSPLRVLQQSKPALKLAGYGALIAAPLDHVLYSLLARAFAGRTSRRARVGEVVAANALILPVQNAVYLAALSVLGGARSARQVVSAVRSQFLSVMQMTVVVSTLSLVAAQRWLPPMAWTPFFSLVAAAVDTAINVQAKRRELAAAAAGDARVDKDE
ncbi:hypothetical protein Rhopal_002963-T1 [Rhodotorula paludigena]|uniref:Uncharacterized protein n=1 Tax=Rhodotorula paludigena TaxID=86838 RepID=A0AAV5GL44_9BASI|nr:hypothetical protein Rhopal_002963-T1 [Rhodotorula paludigena]